MRALFLSAFGVFVATSVVAADTPPPAATRATQALETSFKKLDANQDGKLEQSEFEKLDQISQRLKVPPGSATELFVKLDKDRSGNLTPDEFRGVVRLLATAAKSKAASPATKPEVKPAAMPLVDEKPPTAEGIAFFEKRIRPVLAEKCYTCHSAEAEKIKGGLVLDTREGIRTGGDTGHAVVPGDVSASLLIKAIRYQDKDLAMPPEKNGGKLSDEVIADFEAWVKMGAPDPRNGTGAVATKGIDIEKGREHWAFQRPKAAPAPAVKDTAWPRGDIDHHILAGLESKGLKPVGDANKAVLLRRIYFDLIGLPPSPDDLHAFLNDQDPDAFEKTVNRLLASPQYGERWGRHWLDVARYAESSGKESNIAYPHAWRYRDWVVAAINADKPYDQFLTEQLAGDLLPASDDTQRAEQLIATGFLAIGPKSHNTRSNTQFQLDVADEQIDAVTQGMLGLTVACARCHDHKFDPVPQTDYYALAGIFMSTDTCFGTPRYVLNPNPTRLITIPAKAGVPDAPPLTLAQLYDLDSSRERTVERLAEIEQARARGEKDTPRTTGLKIEIAVKEKQLESYDREGNPRRLAMGVQDKKAPGDTRLLQRGELDKPQGSVPRGFIQVLSKPDAERERIIKGSGRAELAAWIASPENPLTARVLVNRVWLNLFDHGIVPTPDNFGTTGQPPANQPLLDSLAISFVEHGWSIKKLVKKIVMSRTYQLASDHDAASYAVDPDNTLHWRKSQRRLEAEEIRDAMLAVAGKLDLTPPKGSVVANVEGPVTTLLRTSGYTTSSRSSRGSRGSTGNAINTDRTCRSIYLPIVRDQVPDALEVFDFAEPSLVTGDREDTTVPSQALYLMNSASVQKLSESMALRLVRTRSSGQDLWRQAFELAYSRQPTENEIKVTAEFFSRFRDAGTPKDSRNAKPGLASLTAFCQALLGNAEFSYLD